MKLRQSASTNPNDNEFVNIATSFYYQLCAWRHNMPLPLQVDNIFVFILFIIKSRT